MDYTDLENFLLRESVEIAKAHELASFQIARLPVVVLDCETTGLDPVTREDRIIQISLHRTNPDASTQTFTSYINPERQISDFILNLTNIDMRDIRKAPLFSQTLTQINEMLTGSIVVAHNALFDLRFLKVEFELGGARLPFLPVIDTCLLARNTYNFPNNRLATVATELGVKVRNDAHRADADVDMTKQIFEIMLSEMNGENDDLTSNHLHDLMAKKIFTYTPMLPTKPKNSRKSVAKLQNIFANARAQGIQVDFCYEDKNKSKIVSILPVEILKDLVIGYDKNEQKEIAYSFDKIKLHLI